jgi:hypothetical protein
MREFKARIKIEGEDETVFPEEFTFEMERALESTVEQCPYFESGDKLNVMVLIEETEPTP